MAEEWESYIDAGVVTRGDAARAAVQSVRASYKIRRVLQGLIRRAADPKAVVLYRAKYIFEVDKLPQLFVNAANQNRVHGWMVTRRRGKDVNQSQSKTERTIVYAIIGAHYYDYGTDGSMTNFTANSEDKFEREIDGIIAQIDAARNICGHIAEPLTFESDVVNTGSGLIHLVQGVVSYKQG